MPQLFYVVKTFIEFFPSKDIKQWVNVKLCTFGLVSLSKIENARARLAAYGKNTFVADLSFKFCVVTTTFLKEAKVKKLCSDMHSYE